MSDNNKTMEERFEKLKFYDWDSIDFDKLKDFINQELQKQKEEILEIIDGMKKDIPDRLLTAEDNISVGHLWKIKSWNNALQSLKEKLK